MDSMYHSSAMVLLDIVGVWTVEERREPEPGLDLVHLASIAEQCHGSTGHCWCVDSRGQERAGTRTAPGASPVDCSKPAPTSRAESVCERWRASLIEHYGRNPDPQQYLPQCEPDGEFSPVQCYGGSTYCWCVDREGREIPGTRSHDAVKPACLPSVAPPTVLPVTRPDVTPPKTAVTLLYAQGQKIGALPLIGSRLDAGRSKTLLTLHGSIVVGIAYDCKENKVYWTDLSARTINRASMASGAEPEMLINTSKQQRPLPADLVSPEGLALDAKRRLMFWVDSNTDVIESASLDGSRRRTLFDSDLVNPRAIVVVSSTGSLYWTDWNREAPKIETSTVDGQGRRVVVSERVGLPNALTYDLSAGQICWADAGTKLLECISPNGSGRRVINSDLNYPFSMVYHSNHFYFSDWRRDGVIAVDKYSSKFTDEYLPEQRSHLYGITIATTHCLPVKGLKINRCPPFLNRLTIANKRDKIHLSVLTQCVNRAAMITPSLTTLCLYFDWVIMSDVIIPKVAPWQMSLICTAPVPMMSAGPFKAAVNRHSVINVLQNFVDVQLMEPLTKDQQSFDATVAGWKQELQPSLSSPSKYNPNDLGLSSADLAQPVVRLGVGYDGLDGDDGLVDLRLQLPQLLDVQQAQNLGRFVQGRVCRGGEKRRNVVTARV
ncbi:hypothetical protein CCH79_00018845 [Gambusia affinis]|uniref:Thyroglobulin type-1 domain-containing protein n=1 Tax=Gambusia affinis TaxID=33528 RepID=A0A315W7X0_GAMAF|nr:hypothetical protein CCH79_00018845 [Gambusia affinis]